jgi:hypothetical protein
MSESMMSFKEMYDVHLKLTYPIEVGNRYFDEGETIAHFDKIHIAGLNQIKEVVSANGGFDNRAHVFWENTKEIQLSFSQGIFSKTQFALMSNSKLLTTEQGEEILITKTESVETDEQGHAMLSEIPAEKVFVYKKETGERISPYLIEKNKLGFTVPFMEIIVTYQYQYKNSAEIVRIGHGLMKGYLELEGKTRVKDDITGQTVTGIIKIPKLKLMSDLSIRLGAQANPVVGNFKAIGVPVGSRGNSYVSEFYFLSNDIDSDF